MQNDIRRPQGQELHQPSTIAHLWHGSRRLFKIVLLIIIAIIIIIFFASRFSSKESTALYNLTGEYQAVFLTNGQTYFGQVGEVNEEVLILNNVHYLQSQTPLQTGPQPKESEIALIKLGSEIHGPQNQMIIPKTSISYIENLKETSAIVRAINKAGE